MYSLLYAPPSPNNKETTINTKCASKLLRVKFAYIFYYLHYDFSTKKTATCFLNHKLLILIYEKTKQIISEIDLEIFYFFTRFTFSKRAVNCAPARVEVRARDREPLNEKTGQVRDTKFGMSVSSEMLPNAAKYQGYSFYCF